jgi:phenylpropionate dioxygenase-like ring-hydroxylating dioxygenase large terminal subunit
MLPIITNFFETYNPYLQPIYFSVAWVFFGLLLWTLITSLRDIRKRGEIMHKIPCSRCQYFTNNHRLKCTLQPLIANTEFAIDCPDFMMKENW